MVRSDSAPPPKRRPARATPPAKPRAAPSAARPEDVLLTTAQVAEVLHLATPTVNRLVREGRLPAHRIPGTQKYLFWRQDVIDLVEASTVRPEDVGHGEDTDSTVTGGR